MVVPVLAVILASFPSAFGASQNPTAMKSIKQLEFLAGTWEAERGTGIVEEVWLPPKGKTMIGMSRTTRDETTTFTEFWQVTENEGKLTFSLQMKLGGPVVEWDVELGINRVLFKSKNDPNKATLEYRRDGDNLNAIVKGERDGEPYTLEFSYKLKKSSD